ncbi:MAG TPA: bifunctional alpha/beta hydrolase/class I SAM-dependent methyltransferase, partial [Tepidisphaeraceae bacterium]
PPTPDDRADATAITATATATATATGKIPTPPGSTEHTFASHDGAALFYRHWPAANETSRAVLLFHRGHEHSARWAETVQKLNLDQDAHVFAWDQRGHGNSPGERGHAASVSVLARDADHWARHLVAAHNIRLPETVVVAHSVGGVVAAAWVHDFAPPVLGLVLATPALRVKLYVPLAVPFLRLKQKLLGPGQVKSYVKASMLTRDPHEAAAYKADKAIFRQIAVNLLLDLHDTGTRLIRDAGAIGCPTLVLGAGRDWVVKLSAQWKFFGRLGAPVKRMEVFAGFGHAIFHETGREIVFDRVRAFVLECFDRGNRTPNLLDADLGGYTRTEYDALRSPSKFHWRLARLGLRTVGRRSDGIRLGLAEGFDSGVMLDYVYTNRPAGVGPLGRAIDRNYLNSIGWRGIRVRGAQLQTMLRDAIVRTDADGRPVHIVDIAAGPGRYVLEVLRTLPPSITATATLRDYKEANRAAARALVARLGLSDRVTIEHGDAFERAALAALQPRPTIAIASGLYELFPENAPLRDSLGGLADAIAPGGTLLYTCQPWHPQVEFIARTLTNREGRPWIMRRRTQGEMDALVAAAGFEKIDQDIDRWGIFTVSAARRV